MTGNYTHKEEICPIRSTLRGLGLSCPFPGICRREDRGEHPECHEGVKA